MIVFVYHDGSQQYNDILYEIIDVKKNRSLASYNFVIWIFFKKDCSHIPMLMNFTYWVISPPCPPFIPPYKYIREIIGIEILGRQQLQIILWNWEFHYYFYGITYCTGELFWE